MAEVRFDDLEGLNEQIGEFGGWSDSILVTQDMIDEFADLTGDRQWIHVDVERAKKESPFGGPVAHGFLTLSLIPRLVPEGALRIVGHASAVNYGAEKLRFLAPVPSGSAIHARSRVVRAEARASRHSLNARGGSGRGGLGQAGAALRHADPLRRWRLSVAQDGRVKSRARSPKARLSTLPTEVSGMASTISTRSGAL